MSGQGGKNSTVDGLEKVFVLLGIWVVVFGALLLIWFTRRYWIITPIFMLRYYEAICIEFVLAKWTILAHWLHLPAYFFPNLPELKAIKLYVQSAPAQEISFKLFKDANLFLGHWIRYPVILILLSMAIYIKFFHASGQFQTAYNMQKLKRTESKNWPQITPVLTLDLLKMDLDEGPWAMAKVPLDFCKEHQLLYVGVDEKEGKKVWKLKNSAAHTIIALQMGPVWQGINSLPIEVKALIVVFLGRASRNSVVANQILAQIAASAGSGKLNFAGVEEHLQKFADSKILKWLEQRHAYVYTLMATLLEIARSDGVLASSEFLWLKPVNRRLWYILNTVGRMTSVVEVSGIYAHWLVEKKLNRAVKTPMVKEAVIALETAIEDSLYIEEGDTWHTIHAA